MDTSFNSAKWKELAKAMRWQVRPFINGRAVDSRAEGVYIHVNPATETPLYETSIGSESDIERAVASARERHVARTWRGISPTKRARMLFELAERVVRCKYEIALLDSLEMGKPIRDALFDAEVLAPNFLRAAASCADKVVGDSYPLRPGSLEFNTFEPRGVVGAIIPWNFPIANAAIKVGPALAAGNTLVLKPSELAPSSALKLAELALEVGIPAGVFNVVPGLGSSVGAALARSARVDFLTFTGSTTVGRKLMELSGQSNGKPIQIECGGKSPNVVFPDVDDLAFVAQAIVTAALWNQGQVCSARTRILVHSSIKDSLLSRVLDIARTYQPDNPLDPETRFGALASPAQRNRVERYIQLGLEAGATAVLKGEIRSAGGCFVAPTIFDRVESKMRIAQEEIFGPVLCVETFTDEGEAIEKANATQYGLAATVWTRDLGRARRLAHAIEAGDVVVRTGSAEDGDPDLIVSNEPQKASGFGSELGIKGLEAYSTLKSVHLLGH